MLSVDDGVPFYPGLVAIAPSPVQKGLIYVGTDDGRLRMSTDDGKTWTDLQDRLPGAEVIVVRRHRSVAAQRRAPFTWRWTTIAATTSTTGSTSRPMAARRSPRSPAICRQSSGAHDPRGCEESEPAVCGNGDRPVRLAEWRHELGRAEEQHADAAVQRSRDPSARQRSGAGIARPRHLGLDKINALQELTPQVIASPAHLFTIAPA